mgnify:CR=1 FL=1
MLFRSARQLDQARAALSNLESGGKVTEIQQAEANLAAAKANGVRVEADPRVSCVVGDDEAGRFIFDVLKREGIDSKNVIVDSTIATAMGTIVVSKSEETRAIMARPHNTLPTKPANFSDYSWIHFDHFGVRAMKNWGISRSEGRKISLDIGYPVAGVSAGDFDLYVPSEKITTDTSTAVRDKNMVVVSRGRQGSVFNDGTSSGVVPAIDVEVVSTLGAGDVFHGALVAAQVWGRSLEESVHIATVVAGLKCRSLDGQSGIPTKSELDAYMAAVRH